MAASDEDLVRMVASLLHDQEFRRALLARLEQESDPMVRQAMKAVLHDAAYRAQERLPRE